MSDVFDRRTFLKPSTPLGLSAACALRWQASSAKAATIVVRGSGTSRPLAPTFFGLNNNSSSGTQHQVVVIVNLATAAVTVDLASRFPGTISWSRTRAVSLTTRITGPSSRAVTNGTATGSLSVPTHRIVRIFQ